MIQIASIALVTHQPSGWAPEDSGGAADAHQHLAPLGVNRLPDLAAAGELGSGALPVMPVQPQSRRVENARKPRRSHDHCVG
jgi:hypothetical protein